MNENIDNYNMPITDKNNNGIPIKANAAIFCDENKQAVRGIVLPIPISDLCIIHKGDTRWKDFSGIVGQSKKMEEIYTLIEEISESVLVFWFRERQVRWRNW